MHAPKDHPSKALSLGAAATPYSLTILMDQNTVDALTNAGYQLCAFKAVNSAQNGVPLVWFATSNFATNNSFTWSEQYLVYTSTTQVEAGVTITASNSYDISLGQELVINGAGGSGTLQSGSDPLGIQVQNNDPDTYTTGMGQMVSNVMTPMCAFSIYPGFLIDIQPIEKVVLMFSTSPLNTGSVIEQAFSPGILLDLTDQNNAVITFNIEPASGTPDWSGANCSTSPIAAGTEMAPILINA